jgi:hypothetical protein
MTSAADLNIDHFVAAPDRLVLDRAGRRRVDQPAGVGMALEKSLDTLGDRGRANDGRHQRARQLGVRQLRFRPSTVSGV